jgi:hypothetical protein
MLSRPYRITLSILLFLTSIALLPFELMHAGVAPVWVGRLIDSVCYGGSIDWIALYCIGLHIWAKVGLFGPSLGLVIASVVLLLSQGG